MMMLTNLVLLLALGGGNERDDLRGEVLRQGEPFVEALEDLRRRLPASLDDATAPAAPLRQEGEKQEPPVPPSREPKAQEAPALDLGWLELYPRIGFAAFGPKYHVDPSFFFGVAARAPMPWLSPSSNPHGEYFGLFVELDVSVIKRDIFPKLEKDSGPIFMLGFGLDYTIYRSESWLLMVEAGAHYINFGGITDLTNGLTPMAGIITGITVSPGVSLTLMPELVFPKTGDYIMMISLGLGWEF